MAAFSHANIWQLHDVGPNYIVMELIDGMQLSGPLPVDKAVAYAGQILDALDASHRKKFTHRDLKPACFGTSASARIAPSRAPVDLRQSSPASTRRCSSGR
jgi:serine/threonine protein kinase